MGGRGNGPLRPGALIALTALVTAAGASGVLPRWPGLIHLVGLPPLGRVVAALVLLLLTAAAAWIGSGRLRSGFAEAGRHGLRAGTVGAYLALLTVLGGVAVFGGPAASVALVPVPAAPTYAAASWLHVDSGLR